MYDNQQSQQQESSSLELSNLYQFWKGNGVAYQLPKSLRILTNKVNNQVGQIYTQKAVKAGGFWSIEFTVELNCLKYSEDLGLAIWLTQINPQQNVTDYSYQNNAAFFGNNSYTNGLMVLYSHDSINVGYYNSKNLTREDLLYGSKNCKIYTNQSNTVRVLIRYSDFSNLSVYFIDPKTGQENLCRQEQEILHFDQFYISVTGTDKNGQCFGEVKNMILKGSKQTKYSIIDYKQKQVDDDNYAYHPESISQKNWEHFETYQDMLSQMRYDTKIMAQELLEFADKNEKEMVSEFKDRMMKQIDKTDGALEIIEKEAFVLQNLSDYSTEIKRNKKKDFNDILEQMLEWMRQLEQSYDKVDKETEQMYSSLNEIGFNDKIVSLITKTETVQQKLSSILNVTQFVKNQHKKNSFQTKNLKKLIKNVKNLHQNTENFAQKSQQNQSTIRFVGLSLLVIISLVIVLAFLFMYCKVRKAVHEKRVLQLIFQRSCYNERAQAKQKQLRQKIQNKQKKFQQQTQNNKKKEEKKYESKIIKLKRGKGGRPVSFKFFENLNEKLKFKNNKMDRISNHVIQQEWRI